MQLTLTIFVYFMLELLLGSFTRENGSFLAILYVHTGGSHFCLGQVTPLGASRDVHLVVVRMMYWSWASLVLVSQEVLIYWDFPTKQSPGFMETKEKSEKRNDPVIGSSVGKTDLLMPEVRWMTKLVLDDRKATSPNGFLIEVAVIKWPSQPLKPSRLLWWTDSGMLWNRRWRMCSSSLMRWRAAASKNQEKEVGLSWFMRISQTWMTDNLHHFKNVSSVMQN